MLSEIEELKIKKITTWLETNHNDLKFTVGSSFV
jgi:hypothetical protein